MVEVQLSRFQGPLDLLLHLISKAKIDIQDIFVSQITEQYLLSVQNATDLDMDSASEFLQMAAVLLEIKSRSLLPKPPKLEEGEEDPRETLLRRLEEYKRIKEASQELKELEKDALDRLYRLPQEMVTQQRVELSQMSLGALQQAFIKLMQRPKAAALELAPQRRIVREKWTVARCAIEIMGAVAAVEQISFFALFDEEADREQVVSTFIAMLELLKAGRIKIIQESAFEEIMIAKGEEAVGF